MLNHRALCAGLLGAALLSWGTVAVAEPGPAYLVEPGGPANSVPMDPQAPEATPADPAAAPDEPGDDANLDSAIPDSFDPATAAPAPAPSPDATPPPPVIADDDLRALDEFRPKLDSYGSWVDDPSYGTVWEPDSTIVGMDFAPYLTAGRWVMDGSGNRSWASDYPFGDVVFHYGRWVWASRGWAWIPGYTYAPAWVAWRVPTDTYSFYGWAPLPPDFIWVNRAAASLSWRSSYYWLFCSGGFLMSNTPANYVVRSASDARSLSHHTRTYLGALPHRSSVGLTVSTRLPHRTLSTLPPPAGAVRYVPGRRGVARAVAPGTARAYAPAGAQRAAPQPGMMRAGAYQPASAPRATAAPRKGR